MEHLQQCRQSNPDPENCLVVSVEKCWPSLVLGAVQRLGAYSVEDKSASSCPGCGRNVRIRAELIKSAASGAKVLKRQWMRAVPDLVPWCRTAPKTPKTQRTNKRGKPLIPQRILAFKMVPGGGMEPHEVCPRRILSFLRRL